MFAEYKDNVFLVIEHQSAIAREGWQRKMHAVWGRETTPLVLAGVKLCYSVRVPFADPPESHNFSPDVINLRENKVTQILEGILIRSEFSKQYPVR